MSTREGISDRQDIVSRLRFGCPFRPYSPEVGIAEYDAPKAERVMMEAADRIEQLERELLGMQQYGQMWEDAVRERNAAEQRVGELGRRLAAMTDERNRAVSQHESAASKLWDAEQERNRFEELNAYATQRVLDLRRERDSERAARETTERERDEAKRRLKLTEDALRTIMGEHAFAGWIASVALPAPDDGGKHEKR